MERLLHYAWKCHILPLRELRTTDGRALEVIDSGQNNQDAGPDFFNAKVRIDGTVWAGNVEIHLRSSDWFRHGHHEDEAYDNVVLHVTENADVDVVNSKGKTIPQVVIPIPDSLRHNYEELLTTMDYPRCHKMIPEMPMMMVHSWMDALLCERLQERSGRVLDRLRETGGDWERTLMMTLARNFGFSLNGDAFERWGRILPLSACGKHRDDLFQIESIFIGLAGLLDKVGDEAMKSEFAYLAHKFTLTDTLQEKDWKYMRTRPQNFPHVRLLQLAQIYQRQSAGMSQILDADTRDKLHKCFSVNGLSSSSMDLLIINTVVPVLYAYGVYHRDEKFQQRAIELLEGLKAESNYILRQWSACGLSVKSAADSQALIQLKREYCDRKDCLRCRFGYEYLKVNK